MDCVFCKIVRGELPSAKIYEDGEFLAFLDITPVNLGHALVIPKKHSENIHDTDEKTLSLIFPVVKKVSGAVKEAMNAGGVNIGINNGKAAGQIVPHFHIHIMPRLETDNYKLWHGRKKPSQAEMAETAEKIRRHL